MEELIIHNNIFLYIHKETQGRVWEGWKLKRSGIVIQKIFSLLTSFLMLVLNNCNTNSKVSNKVLNNLDVF